jgi:YD repeat-containing protein
MNVPNPIWNSATNGVNANWGLAFGAKRVTYEYDGSGNVTIARYYDINPATLVNDRFMIRQNFTYDGLGNLITQEVFNTP